MRFLRVYVTILLGVLLVTTGEAPFSLERGTPVKIIALMCSADVRAPLELIVQTFKLVGGHYHANTYVVGAIKGKGRVRVLKVRLQPGIYGVGLRSTHCFDPGSSLFAVAPGLMRTIVLAMTSKYMHLPPPVASSIVVVLPAAGVTAHLTSTSKQPLSPSLAYGVADGGATYFDGLSRGTYHVWIDTSSFTFCSKTVRIARTPSVTFVRIAERDLMRELDVWSTAGGRRVPCAPSTSVE
jgi:hypothetical protein